jgi:hypothetical protein
MSCGAGAAATKAAMAEARMKERIFDTEKLS